MKISDWTIISLIIFCWGAEYLYLLAPAGVTLEWIFTDAELSYRWYVFLITIFARLIIFAASMLIRQDKMHFITKDVLIINIIVVSFSLIWFVLFYHNPFKLSEVWIKIIVTILIYFSIYSIRRHGRHNDRISSRSAIRRID